MTYFRYMLTLCLGMVLGWWLHSEILRTNPDQALVGSPKASMEVAPVAPTSEDPLAALISAGDYEGALDAAIQADAQKTALLAQWTGLILQEALKGQCVQVQAAVDLYIERESTSGAIEQIIAICVWQDGFHEVAIFRLLDALAMEVQLESEEERMKLLDSWVGDYTQKQRELGDWESLDTLYQNLMLRLPELARYYLDLARIRIQAGDMDGAIDLLLQIQQDQVLGRTARQLIDELEAQQQEVRTQSGSVPLDVAGNRLVVDAVLDGSVSVRLMVDTGAAVTMVQPAVLRSLGYHVEQAPLQRFNTANGQIDVPVIKVVSLALDEYLQPSLQIAAADLPGRGELDGLLGMNFLRHYRFVIDHDKQVLFLLPR